MSNNFEIIIVDEPKLESIKIVVDKSRCFECHKKIPLTSIECRCGYMFCQVHRYFDKHNCKFNYTIHDANLLKNQNQKITATYDIL